MLRRGRQERSLAYQSRLLAIGISKDVIRCHVVCMPC
jgi:hypothetical protein